MNSPDGDGYLRCARHFAEIQERAGAFFPLPIAFDPEDRYWMDYASKLLRGEDVQISWPGSTAQCDRDQVRFFLEETAEVGETFTFFNRSQETLDFAGGKVSLGLVAEIAGSADSIISANSRPGTTPAETDVSKYGSRLPTTTR